MRRARVMLDALMASQSALDKEWFTARAETDEEGLAQYELYRSRMNGHDDECFPHLG